LVSARCSRSLRFPADSWGFGPAGCVRRPKPRLGPNSGVAQTQAWPNPVTAMPPSGGAARLADDLGGRGAPLSSRAPGAGRATRAPA